MLHFWRDERGSATIEFVLWVPMFTVILMMMTDATFMYLSYAQMVNASRDAARQVSIGRMTPDEAKNYVQNELLSTNYIVQTQRAGDLIEVTVQRPYSEIAIFPIFSALFGDNLGSSVRMRMEPGL